MSMFAWDLFAVHVQRKSIEIVMTEVVLVRIQRDEKSVFFIMVNRRLSG
jgi:hypothetical protein